MKKSNCRLVLGVAVALVAAGANITPASAMGRSSVPNVQKPSVVEAHDHLARSGFAETQANFALQNQVEALRKEVDNLKTQVAIIQGVASTD